MMLLSGQYIVLCAYMVVPRYILAAGQCQEAEPELVHLPGCPGVGATHSTAQGPGALLPRYLGT